MRNIEAGRPPGQEATLEALRRRGWIDQNNNLTPAGVAHLKRYDNDKDTTPTSPPLAWKAPD